MARDLMKYIGEAQERIFALYRRFEAVEVLIGRLTFEQTPLPEMQHELLIINEMIRNATDEFVADAFDASWEHSKGMLIASLAGVAMAKPEEAVHLMPLIDAYTGDTDSA